MELKVNVDYPQVLELVRQLSERDVHKLVWNTEKVLSLFGNVRHL